MSTLTFHKCKLCRCIFYSSGKCTYCSKCIPKFSNVYKEKIMTNNIGYIESKRAKERARWKARMANPAFREHERLRSLVRARAERKYVKGKE